MCIYVCICTYVCVRVYCFYLYTWMHVRVDMYILKQQFLTELPLILLEFGLEIKIYSAKGWQYKVLMYALVNEFQNTN